MSRRLRIRFILLGVFVGGIAVYGAMRKSFPNDRTPEGAYVRIAKAVNQGRPEDFFAYIETAAQHAAYSIREYRKKARDRVLAAYPEPERTRVAKQYEAEATASDGPELFAVFATEHGFIAELRRDLSGIAKVDVQGERATIETVRGTRYAFRRRENGIWGLTLFTAALVSEAEKAARDEALIERAADDYQRVGRALPRDH